MHNFNRNINIDNSSIIKFKLGKKVLTAVERSIVKLCSVVSCSSIYQKSDQKNPPFHVAGAVSNRQLSVTLYLCKSSLI